MATTAVQRPVSVPLSSSIAPVRSTTTPTTIVPPSKVVTYKYSLKETEIKERQEREAKEKKKKQILLSYYLPSKDEETKTNNLEEERNTIAKTNPFILSQLEAPGKPTSAPVPIPSLPPVSTPLPPLPTSTSTAMAQPPKGVQVQKEYPFPNVFSFGAAAGGRGGGGQQQSTSQGTRTKTEDMKKSVNTWAAQKKLMSMTRGKINTYLEQVYWPSETLSSFKSWGKTLCAPRCSRSQLLSSSFPPEVVDAEEERFSLESQALSKWITSLNTDTICFHPNDVVVMRERKATTTTTTTPTTTTTTDGGKGKIEENVIPFASGKFGSVYFISYQGESTSGNNRVTYLSPSSPDISKRLATKEVRVLKVLRTRLQKIEDIRAYFSFLMEGVISIIINTLHPNLAVQIVDVCKTSGTMSDVGIIMEYIPKTLHDFLWDDPEAESPTAILLMLYHVVDNLSRLQKSLQLEHGDFRCRNIMCDKKADGTFTTLEKGIKSPYEVKIADLGRARIVWDGTSWCASPFQKYKHFPLRSDLVSSSSISPPPSSSFSSFSSSVPFDTMGSSRGRGGGGGGGSRGSKTEPKGADFTYDLAFFFGELYLEVCGRHPSLNERDVQNPGEKQRIVKRLSFLRPFLKHEILKGIDLENPKDEYRIVRTAGHEGSKETAIQLKPLEYVEAQIRKRKSSYKHYSSAESVKEKILEEWRKTLVATTSFSDFAVSK